MSGSARRPFAYRLSRYGYRKPLVPASNPAQAQAAVPASARVPAEQLEATLANKKMYHFAE
ncbi:hypothetical protein [Hymenobacter weizhouensis]|uniref:hypothetical protein n=1 Tax=Hymenobacter sp. YIM 151500-1 TaxID=2987689 RepID=UPI0022263851|nr:hypothetical protein [Hymenobacter sp. YIM 151500-1]UYZ61933.1 hypothetical protein OIS53_13085 [Hymenobacter sp. YIM 151500-1]